MILSRINLPTYHYYTITDWQYNKNMKKRYRFRPLGIVTQNLKRHRLPRIRWHALVEVDPMERQVLPWVTEVTLLGPFDPNPKRVLFSVPKNSPIDAVAVGVLIFRFCSVSAREFKATKDEHFLYISTILLQRIFFADFWGRNQRLHQCSTQRWGRFQHLVLCFFENFLDIFLSNEIECQSFFAMVPCIRSSIYNYKKSTYKEVGSKVIKIFIETVNDCSLMDLVEVNCCFCVIIDTVRQLVVVLLEIFKNLLSNNWVTAHENFFIFFSILVSHPVFACISL